MRDPFKIEQPTCISFSSGRTTVWLNREAQNEPHNHLARDKSGTPGTLTLRLSNGQVLLLKPGQRYDPASGTVTEAPP